MQTNTVTAETNNMDGATDVSQQEIMGLVREINQSNRDDPKNEEHIKIVLDKI